MAAFIDSAEMAVALPRSRAQSTLTLFGGRPLFLFSPPDPICINTQEAMCNSCVCRLSVACPQMQT